MTYKKEIRRMHTDEDFIRMAMGMAEKGDTPFGAIIVQHGKVIATGYNTVSTDGDVTAHSEINALRAAARELGTTNLEDCIVYSNAEPCPMCMTAILWSRVPRLVFGARNEELAEYVPTISLSSRQVAAQSGRSIEIVSGILEDLCMAPFRLKYKR